ncbi:MAG TPA: S8 family serine peptidase [Candidatus Acidoferrales bacterium]|nr:S8 family serine peptidase [Candidatus Acidoferrales bacterium]
MPSRLLFLGAVLLMAASPVLAQQPRRIDDPVGHDLQSLESGGPVPIANRPLASRVSLAERFMGRVGHVAPHDYVEPAEFGVTFQFDGSRAALTAAGIRVQSQIGSTFTARVRRDEIGKLRAVAGLRSVRLARYLRPHLDLSIPDIRANLEHNASGSPPVYAGRAGQGMLIGDVDTGIDWTLSDFKDPATGKTRVVDIWDQNDAGGPSPSGFGYGTEWTKANIDNTPGNVREVDSNGHGTNVAGVLVGNGSITGCSMPAYRFVGVAPLAQFVEVATDFSDAGIIDGVNYIFQKAASLGLDCVVNLSLGGQFGPHDGSDLFTQSLSALTGPGRIIVASAGNDETDQIHGKRVTTSTTVGADKYTFNVPTYTANGGTFNDYVLVTGWYDPTANITIRVKGPNAGDTLSVGMGDTKDRNLTVSAGKGGKLFIANQNVYYGYDGTSKAREFEVEVYDSIATSPPRSGTWEIDVVPNSAASIGARTDIWIYDDLLGAVGVAPTVTTNADATTLVAQPAVGDSIIAVGAHATKAAWTSCSSGSCGYTSPPTVGAIASFSNVGPRRDGVLKPELTAPGFGVATTWSSLVALGTCEDADDGMHGVTQGTSFSAPHVSGAVALFMQYAPHATPSEIRQTFEAHARADGFTGTVPNNTWGYGKLDIYSTIDHVAPTCAVTSPIGGEMWAGGSSHTITWTASDNVAVTTVDVAYSLRGAGGPWVPIVTGVANSGSTPWTLPAGPSDSALVQVTAHDQGGNQTAAQSPALFHVTGTASVPPPSAAVFWLAPPVPNPSNGSVNFHFSLARPGPALLEVFGVGGERIWSQDLSGLPAGQHMVVWQGQRSNGAHVGTGLFFVKLRTADGVKSTRLARVD